MGFKLRLRGVGGKAGFVGQLTSAVGSDQPVLVRENAREVAEIFRYPLFAECLGWNKKIASY